MTRYATPLIVFTTLALACVYDVYRGCNCAKPETFRAISVGELELAVAEARMPVGERLDAVEEKVAAVEEKVKWMGVTVREFDLRVSTCETAKGICE